MSIGDMRRYLWCLGFGTPAVVNERSGGGMVVGFCGSWFSEAFWEAAIFGGEVREERMEYGREGRDFGWRERERGGVRGWSKE